MLMRVLIFKLNSPPYIVVVMNLNLLVFEYYRSYNSLDVVRPYLLTKILNIILFSKVDMLIQDNILVASETAKRHAQV